MRTTPLSRIQSTETFHDNFFLAAQPVVIEGGARSMRAFSWSDAHLIEALGETKPLVRMADGRRGQMSIAAYLEYLAAPERFSSSLGPAYLTDFPLFPSYGERGREILAADIACPLPRREPMAEWITLYAGPTGTATFLHQDVFSTNTWLANLRGEKRWRVCAPTSFTAPDASVDLFGEADIRDVQVFDALLGPGDLIYLPPDWWHQVRNERGPSMALSGNFCTYEHARAALREAESNPNARYRESWTTNWKNILAEGRAA